jgi:ketosteroid isomerase-like protein
MARESKVRARSGGDSTPGDNRAVSQANVDLVRGLYPEGGLQLTRVVASDEAAEETRRALAPHLAPGFEWAGNSDAVGNADPAGGLDAFVENYRELSQAFEEAVLEPIEISEHGDKVLVLARISGRLARSDTPYEGLAAAVYTFEDGKIKRIEEFTDLDQAHAAVDSVTNLELAKAFFAGNPDDLVAAIEDPKWVGLVRSALERMLTQDFEFVTVSQSVGMPGAKRGVEGFLTAYRAYGEMWESYSLRPQRFVEVGDKVVVEARIAGTTRTGGVQLEQDVAAVYSFAGGRISRIEEFSDVASAYDAAQNDAAG